MIEEVTGSGKLLSRVQKLENKLKDSEQKRMDLIQENTNLQKILKACREQEDHTRQEMANLKELLSVLSSQVRRVEGSRDQTSHFTHKVEEATSSVCSRSATGVSFNGIFVYSCANCIHSCLTSLITPPFIPLV